MVVWGATVVSMGPFRVELDSRFGPGETSIALPPFGNLEADTHLAPLRLTATLKDISIQELTEALGRGSIQDLAREVQSDAIGQTGAFALRILAVSVGAALALSLLAFRRNVRAVEISVVTALLSVGASLALAAATFAPGAFLSPTFSGSLELAPEVVGPVRAAGERFDEFRAQLERVVDGAIRAYTSVRTSPLGREGEIRVLHISDIHLSTLGYEFALQIAEGFDVDLVIDTGDTTSFGTPVEELILDRIPQFEVPYVWVRGSHDSRALQAEVADIRNAVVLDGNAERVKGLTIYGLGHPVFVDERTDPLEGEEFAELALAAGDRVLADVEALDTPPDLVLVHDDRMAEAAAGAVPLVASGHFHENRATVEAGTLFLRVGTTGGAGPTAFTAEGGVPLSAEVLYFEPAPPGQSVRLIAYDRIEQSPETGSLTVSRTVVAEEFGELVLTPSPTVGPTGATGATGATGSGSAPP